MPSVLTRSLSLLSLLVLGAITNSCFLFMCVPPPCQVQGVDDAFRISISLENFTQAEIDGLRIIRFDKGSTVPRDTVQEYELLDNALVFGDWGIPLAFGPGEADIEVYWDFRLEIAGYDPVELKEFVVVDRNAEDRCSCPNIYLESFVWQDEVVTVDGYDQLVVWIP